MNCTFFLVTGCSSNISGILWRIDTASLYILTIPSKLIFPMLSVTLCRSSWGPVVIHIVGIHCWRCGVVFEEFAGGDEALLLTVCELMVESTLLLFCCLTFSGHAKFPKGKFGVKRSVTVCPLSGKTTELLLICLLNFNATL